MATADDYAAWIVKNADKKGTPEFDIVARAYQEAGNSAPPAPRTRTLADQLGLTARAGIKGLAAPVALFSDALGGLTNTVQNVVAGRPNAGLQFKPASVAIDELLDRAGLPRPETSAERIASTGAELMTGAGAGTKLAQLGLRALTEAAPVAREVFSRLSKDPVQQVVSAGSAGLAGQQAQEAGAGPLGQFISAAGGGVLGAGSLALGRSAVDGVKSLIPRQQQMQMARVDQTINVSLQSSGIDPATITPAMRASLREQVGRAMDQGQLDDRAVARLADYTRLGTTPTRGRLTLDPFDITQEQNASRMAAATGQRDVGLPAISNANNARLLTTVDGFNPSADRFATGQRAMAPIQAMDRAMEASKTAAYRAANEMAGGDIPLQRGGLNGVYDKLNAQRKLRFVPENVMGTIDDTLNDTRAPFTVNDLDALKSTIATAQRGTQDGNVKAALKIVRDHLDSMPLTPEKATFGGNQVVTEQGATFLRNQDAQAGNLKAALDAARGENFSWRRWQESAPAIQAAVDDATPETFVKNFIRNQNADSRDVMRAADVINTSPDARNAVRSELVQHLKDAAIGKGNQSETGNFSGRAWVSALDGISRQKLALFFAPEEIETLRALGRVGTYETFQPRGSAVNNSNTAAGLAGALQGILKYSKPLANKLPFGELAISNPLQNITLSVMQRGANDIPRSLLVKTPVLNSLLDPLVLPATLGGGLLSAP
jgi:hypothetical protein